MGLEDEAIFYLLQIVSSKLQSNLDNFPNSTGVPCQLLALFKLCISLPTVSRRIFLMEFEVGAYILQCQSHSTLMLVWPAIVSIIMTWRPQCRLGFQDCCGGWRGRQILYKRTTSPWPGLETHGTPFFLIKRSLIINCQWQINYEWPMTTSQAAGLETRCRVWLDNIATTKDNKNGLWLESTVTDLPENSSKRVVYCHCAIMVFACEACGSSFKYNSDRGLHQHQLNCEEFLQANNEASTVDDALEKYWRKLQIKKHKATLSEASLTGSGVSDAFNFYFISILLIHCRMHPWL